MGFWLGIRGGMRWFVIFVNYFEIFEIGWVLSKLDKEEGIRWNTYVFVWTSKTYSKLLLSFFFFFLALFIHNFMFLRACLVYSIFDVFVSLINWDLLKLLA